jgi:uncharacterized protein
MTNRESGIIGDCSVSVSSEELIAMFKIGVLSDTHGYLDPRIPGLFEGVQHILHAGDIGPQSIITTLEETAPVTAVVGNTDCGLTFSETEAFVLAKHKFLLHHIVDVWMPSDVVKDRVARDRPEFVIFGHTHRQCCNEKDGVTYLNPGYSGLPKPRQKRSVAILNCSDRGVTTEFLEL